MTPYLGLLEPTSSMEERQTHFSCQLRFYGLQLTREEMESLASSVVSLTSVRWMWISSYVRLRKMAQQSSSASGDV